MHCIQYFTKNVMCSFYKKVYVFCKYELFVVFGIHALRQLKNTQPNMAERQTLKNF